MYRPHGPMMRQPAPITSNPLPHFRSQAVNSRLSWVALSITAPRPGKRRPFHPCSIIQFAAETRGVTERACFHLSGRTARCLLRTGCECATAIVLPQIQIGERNLSKDISNWTIFQAGPAFPSLLPRSHGAPLSEISKLCCRPPVRTRSCRETAPRRGWECS